ncbi:hypothetical protein ACFX1R_006426 [Malus domestica]
MWMHNVATAVMMMPVATGILRRFPTDPDQSVVVSNFCKAVILGVLYSHSHRRDEHSDGDRCQSHIGWNVEELFPTSCSDHLQHLVLFRLPFGIVDVLGFVGFVVLG